MGKHVKIQSNYQINNKLRRAEVCDLSAQMDGCLL